MTPGEQDQYGETYAEWKNWGCEEFGRTDGVAAEYYDAELARAGVADRKGLRVLEIGFGNGGLLAHLKAKGWSVVGTEVSEPLVARAKGSGLDVRCTDTLDGFEDETFDLVLAFDVLEHIPQDVLPSLLGDVRRVLREGGTFLARFPNGDSPLGLANQHGDLTHVTTIGSAKARFLCDTAGLSTRLLDAPARTVISRNAVRTAYNLLLLAPRWVVEKAVKLMFFPQSDIKFFSSNLVVVAEKTARAG